MEKNPNCPKCSSEFVYEDGANYVCPECSHEWAKTPESIDEIESSSVVKDAHGNELKDGDSVTIIKDIKVKGTSSSIKIGVKVKGIRLVPEVNGHNIDAKIPGIGSILLKSEFVKKCT